MLLRSAYIRPVEKVVTVTEASCGRVSGKTESYSERFCVEEASPSLTVNVVTGNEESPCPYPDHGPWRQIAVHSSRKTDLPARFPCSRPLSKFADLLPYRMKFLKPRFVGGWPPKSTSRGR